MTEHTLNPRDLAQFTGTETWWRHPLTKSLYTDGVRYVAETAGAYWLIDEILLAQPYEAALKATEFQCWTLAVRSDRSATLTCADGNDRFVYAKDISWTDFPLEKVELWYTNTTLYLPSEH